MAKLSALRLLPRSVATAGLVLALAGCVIAGQDRGRSAGLASPASEVSVRAERLVELCESRYRAGHAALAVAACRRALELNPAAPYLLGRIGRLMAALGAPRESAVAYRRQLATDPGNAAAWFANDDTGHFLREEKGKSGPEYVLAELDGPGALVRIWSGDPKGTLVG